MYKNRLLLLVALLVPLTTWAYDFSATVPSGQTLYFDYVVGGVEVVYPGNTILVANGWDGYAKPVGAMTIPATVSDGTNSYSVVSVARYAFHSCVGLTAVTLAEGIDTVSVGAFYQCTGIATLTLPSTLVSVGNGAFTSLTALTDVWITATTPPATSSSAFYLDDLSGCTLHLPCGSAAAYAAVGAWSAFGTVDEMGCTVTVGVTVNHASRGTVTGAGTYLAGTWVTIAAQPAAGYCFVCWNDGDTLNPRLVHAVSDCAYTAMLFSLQHDTVYLADGDTVVQHDTVALHDTVYYAVWQHDTVTVSDTVYYAVVMHDTVYVYDTVFSTVTVHDTIVPTYFTVGVTSAETHLGVGVGSAVLPAGTEAEICGLPYEGCRFVAWDDGNTSNPRQVTVTGNLTFRALFEQVSVTEAEKAGWTATARGRSLSIDGVEGTTVRIYDLGGRCLLAKYATASTLTVQMPAAGVYLVQVDRGAARRIVIDN